MIWKPNSKPQAEFLSRLEDVAGYGGSKGPGKTDALLYGALRFIVNPRYRALILRRTFPRLQECIDRAHSAFPRLGAKWHGDLHRYSFPSAAVVQFGHCESEEDKRTYQGHEWPYIGFDQLEEFTESQYDFICSQNRSNDPAIKCRIRWTANPGGPGHWWVKRRFIDGIEPGKTYTKEFKLPDGHTVSRTFCFIRGTAYDNPALPKTYIANLMSLPESDRKALLEGDWDVYVSQCIFSKRGMQTQERHIEEPKWTGYLRATGEFIEFHEDAQEGRLKVWMEPNDHERYQIGSDASGGVEEGDASSAHVVNKRTWEVVASWHGIIEPSKYAEILNLLSLYYGGCEIAQENDKFGAIVNTRLKDMDANLYRSQSDKYGWESSQSSRHHMLSTLQDAVSDNLTKIRDRETMDEMYNFIRNPENGKWEARSGCHDDRVISLGIALQTTRVNPFIEEGKFSQRRMTSMIPERKQRERVGA